MTTHAKIGMSISFLLVSLGLLSFIAGSAATSLVLYVFAAGALVYSVAKSTS